MTAEIREKNGLTFVVDVECGIEEEWRSDDVGASVRVAEHNEAVHPLTAAGTA